ncbi:MAG: SpoIID/LytB domain-containing protein, partial [Candidatus Omnitrophota bacterium]|nr:SpoIID/LytB domain-containing protein [Candidatus Omnitrophota bacterium]
MAIKSKITLILSLILLLWLGPGYGAGKTVEKPFYVRIAIIQDAASLKIAVHGPLEISAFNTGELLYKGKNLKTSIVLPIASGVKIKDMDFKIYGIRIAPDTSGNIYINGRRFRGEINIIRKENLKLLVINNLELEDYIKGILYHEVSHRWPLEIIKAQAVVARTFAVYQAQISRAKDFDLTADIYSQVYGGKTSETYRTSIAVNRTRGEILNYQDKIFPTFYHATCAGHTEDATELWDVNLAPLKGVACSFCAGSPHFKWRRDLSVSEAENKLVKAGFVLGGLEDII